MVGIGFWCGVWAAPRWIPAYAGMTEGARERRRGAGMTLGGRGMAKG